MSSHKNLLLPEPGDRFVYIPAAGEEGGSEPEETLLEVDFVSSSLEEVFVFDINKEEYSQIPYEVWLQLLKIGALIKEEGE